jgi:hypothetical protein
MDTRAVITIFNKLFTHRLTLTKVSAIAWIAENILNSLVRLVEENSLVVGLSFGIPSTQSTIQVSRLETDQYHPSGSDYGCLSIMGNAADEL